MKIVVVDDDRLVRETVEGILEAYGHTIIACCSGECAVQYLKDADAVVTDFSMGGMTGAELAGICRSVKVPVLIMTGAIDSVPMSHSADRVIQKPFRIKEIISWLEAVC